jgi:hypothetical protein
MLVDSSQDRNLGFESQLQFNTAPIRRIPQGRPRGYFITRCRIAWPIMRALGA